MSYALEGIVHLPLNYPFKTLISSVSFSDAAINKK